VDEIEKFKDWIVDEDVLVEKMRSLAQLVREETLDDCVSLDLKGGYGDHGLSGTDRKAIWKLSKETDLTYDILDVEGMRAWVELNGGPKLARWLVSSKKKRGKRGRKPKSWSSRKETLALAEDWERFSESEGPRATYTDFVQNRNHKETAINVGKQVNAHYSWEKRVCNAYTETASDEHKKELADKLAIGMGSDDLTHIVNRVRRRTAKA
jgi:hypothetical protein